MQSNEILDALKLPGVKLYKSKISNQYFVGMQISNTCESIANVLRFTHSDMTTDEYEMIISINDIESFITNDRKYVKFQLRNYQMQTLRIGSYVLKNQYGNMIIVTEDNFKDTFIDITDERLVDEILEHYFIVTFGVITLNPEGKIVASVNDSIELKTYYVFPPKKVILNSINSNKSIKNIIEQGYKVTITIINIQELTKEQYNAFIS